MNDSYTVGGEIEAWCTKCKLELAHTIVAMVGSAPRKVKCNTCNGQHNYRLKPAERKQTSQRSGRKASKKDSAYEQYLNSLTDGDMSRATKYSIGGNFVKDEIIEHPKFGIGVVLSILKENKVETLFKDGRKLLVQNMH